MTTVLSLTQFAFLALGVVSLKILIHANTQSRISPYLERLDSVSLWLFVIPLIWIAFASVCAHFNRGLLVPRVAQIVGVLVAVACFLFLLCVTFLPTQ